MKTVLFITVLFTILMVAGSPFAAKHGNIDDAENPEPTLTPDLNIILSEFADKEKLETLLLQLKDPDPFVRVEAVQALGERQEKQSLIPICDSLKDENLYVRAYAAEALGKIGGMDIPLTLSKLLPALDDVSAYVRAMIVAALGELQDERAAEAVRELLHDKDESVRTMAVWALNKIENSQ